MLNEKLRAREATLKQLQAQINPHFLYNCLGYIINMAQMKDEEAVVSMAYNLSAYYRYTTRMETANGFAGRRNQADRQLFGYSEAAQRQNLLYISIYPRRC